MLPSYKIKIEIGEDGMGYAKLEKADAASIHSMDKIYYHDSEPKLNPEDESKINEIKDNVYLQSSDISCWDANNRNNFIVDQEENALTDWNFESIYPEIKLVKTDDIETYVFYECDGKLHWTIENPKTENEQDLDTEESPSFKCQHCSYTCSQKKDLVLHMKAHRRSEYLIFCDVCCSRFKTQKGLENHKLVHNKQPYTCELCKFNTHYKCTLGTHVARVHSQKRQFICDACGCKFMEKEYLISHIRTHISEDPLASLLFGQYAAPEMSHERLFVCHICEYTTKYKMNLTKHILIHGKEKTFTCEHCGFATSDKVILNLHHKSFHFRERPYACRICNSTSKTKKDLRKHIRTHTADFFLH